MSSHGASSTAATTAVLVVVFCCASSISTDDSAPTLLQYGGVVTAGGFYNDGAAHRLTNVQVFDMKQLPWLPIGLDDLTVTAVDSVLYSCAGADNEHWQKMCYTLDTELVDLVWVPTVELPVTMIRHTAVAVSSHIWFVFENHTYVLDTTTESFDTYETPFVVSRGHCAVSNSTHSFVLGVGADLTEIWINSHAYSAASWEKVFDMEMGRSYFGCLLYDNEIILTGGDGTEDRVDILDLGTFQMRQTGSMVTSRAYHQMCVLDGLPAVIAGLHNQETWLASIETFDPSSEEWTTNHRVLEQPRDLFAVAQMMTNSEKLSP